MTRASKAWMRGAGPLAVLKLLQEREMYGYELADALDRRSDGVLALGHTSLYPLLYNLEAKGLIRHRATRVAKGRRRKYYGLTADGRSRLEETEAEWADLVAAMAKLGLSS